MTFCDSKNASFWQKIGCLKVAQAEALVFEALYYSDIYSLSVVNFGNTPFYRKVAQKIDVCHFKAI